MALQYLEVNLENLILDTPSKELQKTCFHLKKNKTDIHTLISRLAPHLSTDAAIIEKHFRRIILHIVALQIPLSKLEKADQDVNILLLHIENCIVLSQLTHNPDILQYALKYLQINSQAPFEIYKIESSQSPKKRRLDKNLNDYSQRDIVACCYQFLKAMPSEISMMWNWSSFFEYFIQCDDQNIKWMYNNCLAIVTRMQEMQKKTLDTKMYLDNDLSIKLRLEDQEKATFLLDDSCDDLDSVTTHDIIDVSGIMLQLYVNGTIEKGSLVTVASTQNNLRSLALAVASGKAICLMGPVGCGKTALVDHLAKITGRSKILKKVQLGDQTDSRMLLGTYHCTDVPGEFIWRPGVLTEAVQNGHWLLLEDIDSAALDVASVLSSLLERNCLTVPGYRDSLPVTSGFQLFVTQRTLVTHYGFQKKLSSSSVLLQKHLTQINVEPLSRSELFEVIETLYPPLKTIAQMMVEVFMMFSVGSHDSSLQHTEAGEDVQPSLKTLTQRGSRLISTRDLLKWCARAVQGYNVTSQDSALKVLQDAFDIFTCSISNPDERMNLAKQIGICLGIVETKSEYYCKHYKPNISLSAKYVDIGRAKVERCEKLLDFSHKQAVFSFTRPSTCLLEKIACCVNAKEPVLLVGETGTGKTSSVQYLAEQTGHKLIVINMNQQSDSADLLGGYKPVDIKFVITPSRYEYEDLFRQSFDAKQNAKFLQHIEHTFASERWSDLLSLMSHTTSTALQRFKISDPKLFGRWSNLNKKLEKLKVQIKSSARLTFAFIEGSLVRAMQEGYWVLLDEINLASPEILECLSGLIEVHDETIDLLEKGDRVPIKKHKDFILFACMNPATDVGKKELPVGLRNRFTEFFVDELTEKHDLVLLIGDYLYHLNLPASILEAIYSFYINIRKEAQVNLVDGSGHSPYYSLRTLCRALTAAARAKCGTVSRSLYEAFCLSFLTQLDCVSHPKVENMIAKAVIGKKELKTVLKQPIPEPKSCIQETFIQFEGHWLSQGSLEVNVPDDYVLTPTVRKNLRDIARVISLGKLPVLLQGDTSVGKTSLISYIAKASGNYCVRINNHEHTDIQEYIGAYASDENGKLVFKEGVLVEAMRKGYWIILDELNLAPSDVLEALNRVLDDNRELYIPETQQTVKGHPNFMLFATQNPPGLYGGRKMLSRAFRNRFVELHFDEIPRPELETILHQRCHIPMSYCKKMISVMAELQVRRRGSAAVQGKDGFITLRDLFRWGQRYKLASAEHQKDHTYYDWDQHIADEGYLVLAGKVRQVEERSIILEVLEKHIKRKVDPDNLFTLTENTSSTTKNILEKLLGNNVPEFSHIVWTWNMRRLAILIAKSFQFNEPVLLVGETGCGKTTICQLLAAIKECDLLSVNCHMHTESSDFLGGLRPVRNYKEDGKLFEWVDGPLIIAMEKGSIFLADEISLADDSVLERLNSLLEPERQLLLAERGTNNEGGIVMITAHNNFHFIGTMNPGGDYGKKELSPALRNRFTEIWCDHVTSKSDLISVLEKSVGNGISFRNQEDDRSGIGSKIVEFTQWLKQSEITRKFPFSIRDLLSWVNFINSTVNRGILDVGDAYMHGACLTFLDCFGTALTGNIENDSLNALRKCSLDFLFNQIQSLDYSKKLLEPLLRENSSSVTAEVYEDRFGIKPFYIETGPYSKNNSADFNFTFTAPTTGSNTLRLLRGLQLQKAILLEGNPGVGKTSLVTALAKASGHKIVRINLSDQTDITDLFGTDLPTEDGSFQFREGAFLTALQNGDWILLDELNLAPQPVLEGLNACLDHRGEVFIPELGNTFKKKHQTRLFACQNPLKQGGSRRGLPVSFLNRFTQVYIDTLTQQDLKFIVETQYPGLPKDIAHKIVDFNTLVTHEICNLQLWGHRGSPWEMNLRDVQRWCDALAADQAEGMPLKPGKYVEVLYINRMRTKEDKQKMLECYEKVFTSAYPCSSKTPQVFVNENILAIGDSTIRRNASNNNVQRKTQHDFKMLRTQTSSMKSLIYCVNMNWLSILVGPTATGKSCIVQALADIVGKTLHVVPVTSAMDVTDLIGGYEQVDHNRNVEVIYERIEIITLKIIRWYLINDKTRTPFYLMKHLEAYQGLLRSKHFVNDNTFLSKKIKLLCKHAELLLEQHSEVENDKLLLKKDLKQLEKLYVEVKKSDNLNSGGKFEWVDSLLVKCMIEGYWLLLDNVNLTSSAVLDRLNGLLEPGGVLSIPERGECCDIRPHSDFRIFFTMDPKYGEISRAMRNRGVEIFLLKPDDETNSIKNMMSMFDLNAMLDSVSLPSSCHTVCIEAHDLMCSFICSHERPTVTNLIQAAYLTNQQIERGISFKTALISSFSDIYIKPRSGNDFNTTLNFSLARMKNKMLESLQELAESTVIPKYETNSVDHTLSIREITSNSDLAVVKQLSYSTLNQLFKDDSSDFHHELAVNALQICYLNCCEGNREMLKQYILHIISKIENHQPKFRWFIAAHSKAYMICKQGNVTDYRFFPEMDVPFSAEHCNQQALLLHFVLKRFTYSQEPATQDFSAFNYSKAVLSGNITDDFSEYPLLKYCSYYIEQIDKLIENTFKYSETRTNDESFAKFAQINNWRERFIKACSSPLLSDDKQKIPTIRDDVLTNIYMHFRWLQKYLQSFIIAILPTSCEIGDQFIHCIAKCNLNARNIDSALRKLSKKVRKLFGQPNLYEDENDYKFYSLRESVCRKLCFNDEQPVQKQINKLFTAAEKVNQLDTIALVKNLPSYEDMALFETLNAICFECDNNRNPNLLSFRARYELWPMKEYALMRLLQLIKTNIVNRLSGKLVDQTKNNMMIEAFGDAVQCLECYPPVLKKFFKYINQAVDADYNNDPTIWSKFWDVFYKHQRISPALYPDLFANITTLTSDDADERSFSGKRLSTNVSLLVYHTIQATCNSSALDLRHNKMSDTVSLEDCAEYSKKMTTISEIIWGNMATFKTSALNKNKLDAEFEMNKYYQLVNFIILSLGHKTTVTESISQSVDNCIGLLTEFFALQNHSSPKDEETIKTFIMEGCNICKNLTGYIEKPDNLYDRDVNLKMSLEVTQLSAVYSILISKLMSEVSPIDPIEKDRLKLQYINDDINMFNGLLSAYFVHGLITNAIDESNGLDINAPSDVNPTMLENENKSKLGNVHPFCELIMKAKEETVNRINKYACGNTYRPEEPNYYSFVKDCKHFLHSLLSPILITEVYHKLCKVSKMVVEAIDTKEYQENLKHEAANVIRTSSTWLNSINAFYKTIETRYVEVFPDLAKPLLSGLSHLQYSFQNYIDLVKELSIKNIYSLQDFDYGSAVGDLISFPVLKSERKQGFVERMCEFVTSGVLERLLARNPDSFHVDSEQISMLKMLLHEVQMECATRNEIVGFNEVEQVLNALVTLWDKQQTELKKKKEEEDNLYITSTKCEDINEEEQAQEEIKSLFPSYSDQDFIEFRPPTLEQNKQLLKKPSENSQTLIRESDVSLIYKWHSSFVKCFALAEWLKQPSGCTSCDYVEPLLQRYSVFEKIMSGAWEALDCTFEEKVTPSLLLFVSQIKSHIDGTETNASRPDFYISPWVSEVKCCLPVLDNVKTATLSLLEQWPDFPSLKDILVIVNRILSFPVRSPIARYLTGLELLRDKIEEWNRNAHKGNNMIEVSQAVGAQIISWRKLEMTHWKECLNGVLKRKQSDAHVHWFYLYSVMQSYLSETEEEQISADTMTETLRNFMEKSNLADFEIRLDIIYTLHCHLIHLTENERRNELLSILWNTHKYYSQFSSQLTNYLKEKRAPIEKKLRDYVKICSWDRDLSYWSVKDTVDKAHKVLHKHMKEFETLLSINATNCTTIDNPLDTSVEHLGIWDRPKRNNNSGSYYMIDFPNYMAPSTKSLKKFLEFSSNLDQSAALLQKVSSLFHKAKMLCKDTISSISYPSLAQSLDDFVTQVIETSTHLGSLEVDTTAPKPKQISQAKNIQQQKRKALSDLFKTLQRMGLSYKSGLVILASNEPLYDFTLAPVDLDASMTYMKSRRADVHLSSLWTGCETYYQRNIARHKYLTGTFLQPHQDLGLQNVERCKGYVASLMKLSYSQKKIIAKTSRQIFEMRSLVTNLTSLADNEHTEMNYYKYKATNDILERSMADVITTLQQFMLVLKSCPEKPMDTTHSIVFDHLLTNSQLVSCYQNTQEWERLYSQVKDIENIVKKQKTALHKIKIHLPNVINGKKKHSENVKVYSQRNIDTINESVHVLKKVRSDLVDIEASFKLNIGDNVSDIHPLMNSLNVLNEVVKKDIENIDTKAIQKTEEIDNSKVVELTKKTEDLVASFLLIIQSIYKKHTKHDSGNETEEKPLDVEQEISNEAISENHLKQKLQEEIESDIKDLQLHSILKKLHKVQTDYLELINNYGNVEVVKVVVGSVVPIAEQALLFVEYFVTQQVAAHRVTCKMASVLMKIFSDLGSKGFCKPESLDMEEGDGDGGPGQLSNGTGLGDGEGQKDVSDRIENQDQLDDAKRPGEEDKNEDRDCKEEEKGVNMTDDFDSHLQDVERTEGENESENEDEEEADKQMGETDNTADKLDQQIWGSEDSDLDQDEQEKDTKEEKGSGEKTGEKELGAKEEKSEMQDDQKKGLDKKDKSEINEMEEPQVDDDQVDPYHNKQQQQQPEPEDFEMPENMDGNENEKDEGETETENPFDIDVMKEKTIPEEQDGKDDEKEAQDGENKKKEESGDTLSSDDEMDVDQEDQEPNHNEDQETPAEEMDAQEDANEDEEQLEQTPIPDEEQKDTANEVPDRSEQNEDENKDEPKEQPLQEPTPEANPSTRDPSAEDKVEGSETEKGTQDNVQTNQQDVKDDQSAPYEQDQEQEGDEKESKGRSELNKDQSGHRGNTEDRSAKAQQSADMQTKKEERQNKPGISKDDRTLGKVEEPAAKKQKTVDVAEDNAQNDGGDENNEKDPSGADMFQHVQSASEKDAQVLDAATHEQADEQPTIDNEHDEKSEQLLPEDDVAMETEEDLQVEAAKEKLKSETNEESGKNKEKNQDGGGDESAATRVETVGDPTLTATAQRPAMTTAHTNIDTDITELQPDLTMTEYTSLRSWLKGDLTNVGDGAQVWRSLWSQTASQARFLSERLRLVLEPTGRSRLAGEYRTGRRINMRRVIPYLASQFRKDRIWLRRTKPAKREYKIALAIDDSSSMSDNRSKELAFESLALVSQALNLLESGELAVLSFGERPNLLHPFSEQFSEHSGAKILDQLRFDETKTKIAQLLDFSTVMFEEQSVKSEAPNAKLLVVVSDGRGIFSEGETRVWQAVRRARQTGIFIVYVIVDNPDNKDSIMDIRRPIFNPVTSALEGFVSYLDTFPFPFYVVVRDISALPNVLGDALRQWFELATTNI